MKDKIFGDNNNYDDFICIFKSGKNEKFRQVYFNNGNNNNVMWHDESYFYVNES